MGISWKSTRLTELCEIVMGQSPKSQFYNENSDGLPFFQGCKDFGEIKPTVTKFCSKPNKIAQKSNVLLSVRAPVGEINIAPFLCCIGRGLCALRPKESNRFLFYLLKGNRHVIHTAEGGAVFGAITKGDLENMDFLCPADSKTRDKIASILSAYDDLIENNTQRIKLLEEIAQAIYRAWFVNFRFSGHEKVKIVKSPLGPIPEGWEVVTVQDVVKRIPPGKLYENKTVSSIGSVPVLDQGRSGIIGYHDDEPGVKASEENPIIVFANHTCYQRIIQFPFSAIQNVLPFLPNPERYRDIYWLHWATKDLVKFNDYKGHWPEFMAKKLVLPPPDNDLEFGQIVKALVQQIYKLEQKKMILRKTRDLLLPKLISGEVDVSELDIKTGENVDNQS